MNSTSYTVNKNPHSLIEAEYNPRQLTEKQFADLKQSIETFGFVEPIVINTKKGRENVVVGGHQRLKIAKILNFKKVPCVPVALSRNKERELNVRLNKNSGSWDWDKLANEFDLDELLDWGFEEKDMGLFQDDPEPEAKDIPDSNSWFLNIEFENEDICSYWFDKLSAEGLPVKIVT